MYINTGINPGRDQSCGLVPFVLSSGYVPLLQHRFVGRHRGLSVLQVPFVRQRPQDLPQLPVLRPFVPLGVPGDHFRARG